MSAWPDAWVALHWLRPQWLWALLALPVLIMVWHARRRRASVWRGVVDPHLLPQLLDHRGESRGQIAAGVGALAYVVAILALAGPSWRQVEQPLWQSRTPLVVALDLSSSTLAGDLPPTRLAQARAKLDTLLRERDGGQVGLVAYAGDAFTVAPLTTDVANVALFLDALHPRVMPLDGQRSDRAIQWSARLLQQAGFESGQILLLTDHADASAIEAAVAARKQGYRVSVLGLGSDAGAPYRSPSGAIGTARLDSGSLRSLAQAGGGGFSAVREDREDLLALGVLTADAAGSATVRGETGRSWQDEGYWLLLPLMLLGLFAFRRGGIAVLLVCAILPWQSVEAADLWRRPDQVAHDRMQQAAQAYRAEDYAAAAKRYEGLDSADAHYNRGNALAKAGRYSEAIAAYDAALKRQPGMADAIANKRAVEAAMKRKPPPGQKQKPSGPPPKKPQDPGQSGEPSQSGEAGEPGAKPSSDDSPSPPGKPDDAQAGSKADEQVRPSDAEAQQAADAAQRERMQRALQHADAGKDPQAGRPEQVEETSQQRERRLANEAWLRRVPDDPGGLLREKFRIEYERRQMQGVTGE